MFCISKARNDQSMSLIYDNNHFINTSFHKHPERLLLVKTSPNKRATVIQMEKKEHTDLSK